MLERIRASTRRILRARGGSSQAYNDFDELEEYSPRTRR